MRSSKKRMSSGQLLEDGAEDRLQEGLRQLAVAVEVAEGHLRLDHPELRQVATGVRVLRAEGGAEGVDVDHGQGADLRLELARDREAPGRRRSPGEEPPPLGGPRPARTHANISPAPSASAAVRMGVVQPEEAALLEEVVDRPRGGVAHPQHRADGVRARPQVGDGAQELEAVALLLQRVVVADPAHQLEGVRAQLDPLALARRGHQLPARAHGAAGGEGAHHLLVVRQLRRRDHLQPGHRAAVADVEEGEALRVAGGAQPALHGDALPLLALGEHVAHAARFHQPTSRSSASKSVAPASSRWRAASGTSVDISTS